MKAVSNWSDITINQYFELQSYGEDIDNLTLVSIIYDIPSDEIDDLSVEQFDELVTKLSFLKSKPKAQNSAFISLNGNTFYKHPDIYKIKFGEFVDIEHWITSSKEEDLLYILATMYRKCINSDPDFDGIELEPYGPYVMSRAKHFGELSVTILFDLVDEINKFRAVFQENYQPLLAVKEEEIEDEDLSSETIADKRARLDEENNQKRLNKWGWDVLVYKLAQGDITKFEDVYNLPLIQVMNFLAMQSELKLD